MVYDYGFHKFIYNNYIYTDNGCEINWIIVANLVPSTFLVNRYHLSIFLNIIDNGMAINSLTNFIIGIGQPSGPVINNLWGRDEVIMLEYQFLA